MALIGAARADAATAALGKAVDPAPLGILAALLCAAPLAALLALALGGDSSHMRHLAETRLALYAVNSALVTLGALAGALLLGMPAAWLISRCDFPGRTILSWALAMPLAMPSYVAAYAWMSMTGPGGPLFALGGGALPMVRGVAGAAFVFAVTFYPYVYLLARQAFASQGRTPAEVARSLGAGPAGAFLRAELPLARPAIVARAALAAMEVLADYGVADILGAPTFTVGIVRAWTSFGDPEAAARLALILFAAAMLALAVERIARRARRFDAVGRRESPGRRQGLAPLPGLGALIFCLLPLALGLGAPALHLGWLALEVRPARPMLPALEGTLTLATASALIAVAV
ncbi:MAG: ABC transporter permease, partial [Sphingomonadaceae bacterium]